MALNATMYSFEINLSDLDRNVYQALAFRAAKHPSETDAYLITRVLAYCLEYREGLSFSKGGLSDPDAPALAVHDLTGALQRWIEVGVLSLQGCTGQARPRPKWRCIRTRMLNCCWGDLRSEKIHRAEGIDINVFDPQLITSIRARLARRMTFDLVVTEQQLIFRSAGKRYVATWYDTGSRRVSKG